MKILGIDIGATGIKGAPVSIKRGALLADRHRIDTPKAPKPQQIANIVEEIVKFFEWTGPVGCGFPAMVKNGIVQTPANLDKSWVGTDVQALFQGKTGQPFVVMNDADAAGLAEMEFGAGKDQKGVVVVLTFGTGIGTAVFNSGKLVPNVELGELKIRGRRAGLWASGQVRRRQQLTWKQWAKRVNKYIEELERVILPDLIVLGGGASNNYDKFFAMLHSRCALVPAQMLNEAGIVGAALAASKMKAARPVSRAA